MIYPNSTLASSLAQQEETRNDPEADLTRNLQLHKYSAMAKHRIADCKNGALCAHLSDIRRRWEALERIGVQGIKSCKIDYAPCNVITQALPLPACLPACLPD